MKKIYKFWWYAGFGFFTLFLAVSIVLFFLVRQLAPSHTTTIMDILRLHSGFFVLIFFILLGFTFLVLDAIFNIYIKPIKKIADEATLIYTSNPSHRIDFQGINDLKNLGSVINDFADMFENLNKTIEEQISSAKNDMEMERNLLAAIMAELPEGVIICNKNGRILLFNSLAKKIFLDISYSEKMEHFIGLGRSIFHLVDKGLIAHAIQEIEEKLQNSSDSVASYFITPIMDRQLFSFETIPVLDENKSITGFILTFKEISKEIKEYEIIESKLLSLKNDIKQNIETTQSLVQIISEEYKENMKSNVMYQKSISENFNTLETDFNNVSSQILDTLITKLPLTKISIDEFLSILQKKTESDHQIEINFKNNCYDQRIIIDTYSLTAAFIFILKNISNLTQIKKFDLEIQKEQQTITFDLKWDYCPISQMQIESLLTQKINSLPSLGYVLKQNNIEFSIISDDDHTCSDLKLSLKADHGLLHVETRRSPVITDSRPEFYNFNLFQTNDKKIPLIDLDLKKIRYTVFDTETTGLNPDGGDEIISLAGVRIINNKIQYKDVFEELIDPKRTIPSESSKIHGISYEMIEGKPTIEEILPKFKKFASNTVLLGHNIAFDMKMLKVKEKATNISFSNTILDTLLLSASLHPAHVRHDMENIAKRLGVDIIGRHTALGDSIATAEIFLKLIPLLNRKGIYTLKDAIETSKTTYYARLRY